MLLQATNENQRIDPAHLSLESFIDLTRSTSKQASDQKKDNFRSTTSVLSTNSSVDDTRLDQNLPRPTSAVSVPLQRQATSGTENQNLVRSFVTPAVKNYPPNNVELRGLNFQQKYNSLPNLQCSDDVSQQLKQIQKSCSHYSSLTQFENQRSCNVGLTSMDKTEKQKHVPKGIPTIVSNKTITFPDLLLRTPRSSGRNKNDTGLVDIPEALNLSKKVNNDSNKYQRTAVQSVNEQPDDVGNTANSSDIENHLPLLTYSPGSSPVVRPNVSTHPIGFHVQSTKHYEAMFSPMTTHGRERSPTKNHHSSSPRIDLNSNSLSNLRSTPTNIVRKRNHQINLSPIEENFGEYDEPPVTSTSNNVQMKSPVMRSPMLCHVSEGHNKQKPNNAEEENISPNVVLVENQQSRRYSNQFSQDTETFFLNELREIKALLKRKERKGLLKKPDRLPFTSLQAVQQLEDIDKEEYLDMIEYARDLGGLDLKAALTLILPKLVLDEVLTNFTWLGYGDTEENRVLKFSLRDTKLVKIMFVATNTSYEFESPTFAEWEFTMKLVLRNALQRTRERRKARPSKIMRLSNNADIFGDR